MRFPQIGIAVEGGEVVVSTASDKKRILAMTGTIEAHAKNMIQGVVDGYEYRMKVVYSHFPIQLKQQATASRSPTSSARNSPPGSQRSSRVSPSSLETTR